MEFYPFRKGTTQHMMMVLQVPDNPTQKIQSLKEYKHEDDNTISIRRLKHFTVPGFNNLPLLNASQRYYRLRNDYVEIGEKLTSAPDISWEPIAKIGAVAGAEWEHKANERMTKQYKLVKFNKEKILVKSLKDGEQQDEYLVAYIERRTLITTNEGKTAWDNIEEIGLEKGIGPANWRSSRLENGKKFENWYKTITPVQTKQGR